MEAFTLLFLVLIALLIYKLTAQRYTKEGIPIVGNIPWLGCAINMKLGGAKFVGEMRKKHGDVFQIYAGGRRLHFVFGDDFYEHFYKCPESEISFYEGIKEDHNNFHFDKVLGVKEKETTEERRENSAMRPFRSFFGEYSSVFTERFLAPHVDYFMEYARKEQGVNNNRTFELEMEDASLYLISGLSGCTFAGFDVAKHPDYLSHLREFNENSLLVVTRPLFLTRKAQKICEIGRKAMKGVIDKAVEDRQFTEFGKLLHSTVYNTTGRPYGNEETSHMIFTLLFAVNSNTPTALSNTLTDVLAFPHVKAKVMEDLQRYVVQNPVNRDVKNGRYHIDQQMINNMEYLEWCVSESLRLKASPVHTRKLFCDLASPDGTVLIPKGAYVCTSPFLRHRDERLFEDADEYIPERFDKKNKQKRHSFLGFGSGRHYCLGKFMADTLVRFCVAYLLLHYEMELVNDVVSCKHKNPKIQWLSFGVLRPAAPHYIRFTPKFDA